MPEMERTSSTPRFATVLITVFAAFGIYLAFPKSGTDNGEKPSSAEKSSKSGYSPSGEVFLAPLVRFVTAFPEKLRAPKHAASSRWPAFLGKLHESDGATPSPWSAGKIAAAVQQLGYDLECLIALVPDPVDSRLGYRFDLTLEAIERAVEAEQYC